MFISTLLVTKRSEVRSEGKGGVRVTGREVITISISFLHSLLFKGWRGFLPGREADHAPPSSAEVKNLYSYSSITPRAFRWLNNENLTFMFKGIYHLHF